MDGWSATHFFVLPHLHLMLISRVAYFIPNTGFLHAAWPHTPCKGAGRAHCACRILPTSVLCGGSAQFARENAATSSLCRHHQKYHRSTKSPNDPATSSVSQSAWKEGVSNVGTHAEQPHPVQGHRYGPVAVGAVHWHRFLDGMIWIMRDISPKP